MFTGIIEEVGEVVLAGAGELRVRAEKVLHETKRETASPSTASTSLSLPSSNAPCGSV